MGKLLPWHQPSSPFLNTLGGEGRGRHRSRNLVSERCRRQRSEGDGLTDLSSCSNSRVPHGAAHGFKSKHLSAYWLHEGFSALQTSEADDTSKASKVG